MKLSALKLSLVRSPSPPSPSPAAPPIRPWPGADEETRRTPTSRRTSSLLAPSTSLAATTGRARTPAPLSTPAALARGRGTYTAKVDSALINPNVRCIAFPCTLPEAGKWTVTPRAASSRSSSTRGPKPSRSYFASINPLSRILSLTRYGQTTQLFFAGSTCANVKCSATTHCEMKGINGGSIPVCINNAPEPAACQKTGCSGQVCADRSISRPASSAPSTPATRGELRAPGGRRLRLDADGGAERLPRESH